MWAQTDGLKGRNDAETPRHERMQECRRAGSVWTNNEWLCEWNAPRRHRTARSGMIRVAERKNQARGSEHDRVRVGKRRVFSTRYGQDRPG